MPSPVPRLRSVLAGGLVLLAGCRLNDTRPAVDVGGLLDGSGEATECLVIATSTFGSAGALAVVDPQTLAVRPNVTATHHDAVLRMLGDRLYVINRQGADSVQRIATDAGFTTLWERSVGAGSNPWDLVALDDQRVLLPLYNRNALQPVLLPRDDAPAQVLGAPLPIPTEPEPDGRLEPLTIVAATDVVFVLLQGLHQYPRCAGGVARVVALDPSSLAPLPYFDGASHRDLPFCNPAALVTLDSQSWLVVPGEYRSQTFGSPMLDDGGLYPVDLQTWEVGPPVLTETLLGDRDLVRIVEADADRWIAAVADDDFGVAVVSLERTTAGWVVGPTLWETEGLFDLAVRDGRLWIADRTPGRSGLVVVDLATDTVLSGDRPLDTGLPPYQFAWVPAPLEGCGGP